MTTASMLLGQQRLEPRGVDVVPEPMQHAREREAVGSKVEFIAADTLTSGEDPSGSDRIVAGRTREQTAPPHCVRQHPHEALT